MDEAEAKGSQSDRTIADENDVCSDEVRTQEANRQPNGICDDDVFNHESESSIST